MPSRNAIVAVQVLQVLDLVDPDLSRGTNKFILCCFGAVTTVGDMNRAIVAMMLAFARAMICFKLRS